MNRLIFIHIFCSTVICDAVIRSHLWLRGTAVVRDLRRSRLHRTYAASMLMLFVLSTVTASIQPFVSAEPYQLDDAARKVLPEQNSKLGEWLKPNAKRTGYEYNAGYTGAPNPENSLDSTTAPRITASFAADPSKGVKVTDPINRIDFELKPKFRLGPGRQDQNQMLYPLGNNRGYLVYTAQVAAIKEDILLGSFAGDRLEYEYELGLTDSMEARLERDGSIGVYGASLPINGNVPTGSEKDQQLLASARKNIKKTLLLFNLPAPVVIESNKEVSQVKARFELDGPRLLLVAENLKGASYPLSIDPSVFVNNAQKLMRGNNETNVDFDVANELIKKGNMTGGRFDNWLSGMALPAARWNHGTAVAGGYVYAVGGMNGSTRQSNVYWARLNTTNRAMEATNPGNGACASWCTSSAYNLPVATSALSLVAYNGFLYAFGGETDAGRSNAVYIAKIGVNGEPSLWHPTDTNTSNWTYWHSAAPLSTERSYSGAVAYNNRMYIMGGRTNAAAGGVNTVEVANINPIGTLSTWSTTGMVALPSVRHMHDTQVYNDRLYLIGGNSAGTLQSSVQYIKINNDGTLAGPWVTTTPMTRPRISHGGSFSAIWGGYLYISGGCTAITGTGDWCSVTGLSAGRDLQLASINADGSITTWTTVAGITNQRMGFGLVAWRETIYGIGGCTSQNETTGACATTTDVTNYGRINSDGDVSTTNNSVAAGTDPCSGTDPTSCDIPPVGAGAGQNGRMVMGTALNNGYIYLIGGCTDVSLDPDCFSGNRGQMSGNTSYAALAADGSIRRPPVCPHTLVGSWCVDSTNRINIGTGKAGGLGAQATAVFNNVLYAVGGTDGNDWVSAVNRVTLNDDGSLAGSWTTQNFSSASLGTARGFAYAYVRANPANAGSVPGNLYVLGGCNNGIKSNGIACTTYFNQVYKCNLAPSGGITGSCTTTGQLQLDADAPGSNAGLAAMAGTVYANYMYLIGGSSPATATRDTVMYAKIDNNNNIVPASGTGWTTSPHTISPARQRNAAFGYNGYLYSLAGYTGTGSLNDVLYAKINVNDGSISAFATSNVTVNPRWGLSAIVGNGFVYAIGGCSAGAAPSSCTAMTGAVQTFQLYNNYSGTPAGYAAGTNPAVDRIGGSSIVHNGYIYYAGGCSDMTCDTPQNTVYYAPLNSNGTIGSWTLAANGLPAARAWGKLLLLRGSLYYVGGQDAAKAAQATVFHTTATDGVPNAWNTATNGLPEARTEVGAAVWNGRLYVTGGHAGGVRQSTIFVSPLLATGGDIGSAWTATTNFNFARSGHTAITYANNLYIIGGSDGTNYLSDVQFAKIGPDGRIGGWTFTTSLPQSNYQGDGFAANGYMYLFGGRAASTTCTNITFVSSISANTTIVSGNDPTGVGDWAQTNVRFPGARYGVAAAYDQGRAYLLGGGCAGFTAATDRSYFSTLQSQPAISKYSRMFDTDTDVFPTKWLMNGLDNDVGARWQMRYRSSTAATAAWGRETNYGTVTLGSPDDYVPLDADGVTTNFARYFYMSVSIDSSRAFGYPDDVTRGPTVKDISLFFTSDPSRRLRHGKTFTGGELQPLDTPF